MSKSIFYIDEDLMIATEHASKSSLVVHCEVYRNSHGVIKKFYKEFAKLVEDSTEGGYEHLDTYSPNTKFCELACFYSMGLELMYNNKLHHHYRYDLGGSYGD